jgi:DNA-binding MarR family transcriptional regulator
MSTSQTDDRRALLREVENSCLIVRTRLIARIMTNLYDEELRPFGLVSSQHALLGAILRMGTATRAEIGRANHLDRSTLTRNLKVLMDAGWVEEVPAKIDGRNRPLRLSKAGTDLFYQSLDAWKKGQSRATKLLGKGGTATIKSIADELMTSAI